MQRDQFRTKNSDAVHRLLRGELNGKNLVYGCFEKIHEKEHEIRAFTSLGSPETAEKVEQALPLMGLPIAVKDLYDTCQFPTAYGSTAYVGHRPLADAALVAMIRRRGATILGKTVTTEFAFSHPGPTRNPVNTGHTPGGSSSGSAAAVASGMALFALGTQTAGSIVRPASFCGVAGFKPSFGLWPTNGMKSFSWSLDTVGFFAPTHSAMRVVLDRLSTNEPRACRTGMTRLALCRTPFWEQAHADMQEAVDAAGLASQEMLGWQVSDVTLEASIWAGFSAQLTIQAYEAARCLSGELEMVPDLLSDALKAELRRGLSIEGLDYAKAQLVAREARRRIADLFENYDAILTPSAAGPAPLGLDSTGSPDFNRLWTLLGLPCANVPGFFAKSGLPVGVQLVGPFRQDNGLLQIASDLEEQINLASAERSKQI